MSYESIVMGTRRAAGCDVVVAGDPYISDRHCRITRFPQGWPDRTDSDKWVLVVEDLGSLNGTYVNQVQIWQPTELLIGDQLRIGRTEREIPPYAFWRDT